jgi:hypothetical protein
MVIFAGVGTGGPEEYSTEDLMLNAKYAISCARKVGASVFITPEDIVEVNSKMILTFVAALWTAELLASK